MDNFLLSVIAGLCVAILGVLWRNSQRPSLELSSEISIDTDNDEKCYLVKVKNIGKRAAVNLHAEMYISEIKLANKKDKASTFEETQAVVLKRNHLASLAPYASDWQYSPDHIWRFLTKENLSGKLSGEKDYYIKFSVTAFDGESGKVGTFFERYQAKDIIDGRFCTGNDMTVDRR